MEIISIWWAIRPLQKFVSLGSPENLAFLRNRPSLKIAQAQCDQIWRFFGLWATF